MKLYDYLGIVAMIATPLAAAVLFGWQLHSYLLDSGLIPWLAVTGGLSGAVAIESVGIYAGHVGMDYARRRDWRGVVAGAAMLFYVWFGWSKVPEYGPIFVIAGFVYVLVALRAEAAQVDGATAVVAKEDKGWQHRMELERERMKHQERLARIEAGKVAKGGESNRAEPVTLPVTSGQLPGDFRALTPEQKDIVAAMTTSEIEQATGVSDSTARRWKRQVAANGYHK
jgi:hypothetical protein